MPLIAEPITYDAQVTNPLHKDNAEGGVCHTLNSDSRNYVVIPLQDDGTTSVNKRGPGWNEGGVAYTLNTVDHISVAYGFQKSINGIDAEEEKQPPLQADTHTKAYTLKIRGGVRDIPNLERKDCESGERTINSN